MQPLLTPYFIAECIAFLCSLLLFTKNVDKYFRVFTLYCFLVIVNETLSTLLIQDWHYSSNHVLNNFAILVFFLFYLFSCYKALLSVTKRKFINGLMVLFLCSWLIEVYINSIYVLVDYTLIFGCILVAVAALLYMIQLLSSLEVVHPLRQMFFYVASSYLLYTIPLGIIFVLHKYFAYIRTPVEKDFRYFFSIIMNVSNLLMYLLLSISFIIAWQQQKLSK
ncbi:hypothetical protein FC093_06130 [Ilyomonas limi]|uniref:Uncharacterized protein n=1 Tax=Ilyomonas limi TaxID=2575867 RepID=A0A4U3L5P2_9BACT|nr:hypothetical protein [Ilyomonas limi]TKK70320.1 hypothetical protein FC093_06130 [Ilyomonas limi]